MNDARTMDGGGHEVGASRGRTSVSGQGGVVHAFVEMTELRRMMGCLAAIEVLRLLLESDPALNA
jgi:hypothetical protein